MSSIKLITVGISALFLALVSVLLQSVELCLISAALISVPVTSVLLGRIGTRSLRHTRETPECVQEGEPVRIRIRLYGRTGLLGPIQLNDQLPKWLTRDGDYSFTRDEDKESIVASYSATPVKRGVYTVGPLSLRTSDPLGFHQFNHNSQALTSRLIVLPQPLAVPELRVCSTGSSGEYQFEGMGAKGSGIEFHGVREYRPGDDLRRVHWPSSARHGQLNVIEYEHSRAQEISIALDLKRGSEVGEGLYTSLEYAVRIATAIAESAVMNGSLVSLTTARYAGRASTSGRGRDHFYAILETLARVNPDQEATIAEVLIDRLDSIAQGSTVVCLASSVDEGLVHCVEMLRPRGSRLHLVLITLGGDFSRSDRVEGARLESLGAFVTVVDCSSDTIAAHVVHHGIS